MATITNAASLINNVGTNLAPDSVVIGSDSVDLPIWRPLAAGDLDFIELDGAGSLTLENSRVITTDLRFEQNNVATDDAISLTNAEIIIVKTTTGDTGTGPANNVRGTITSNNSTITRIGNTACLLYTSPSPRDS